MVLTQINFQVTPKLVGTVFDVVFTVSRANISGRLCHVCSGPHSHNFIRKSGQVLKNGKSLMAQSYAIKIEHRYPHLKIFSSF